MEFCPICGIGLSNGEKRIKFCENCRTDFKQDKVIPSIQSRITSLETANAFHKKAAEDAIQVQYRLQKALEEIIRVGKDWDWGEDFWAVRIAREALKT